MTISHEQEHEAQAYWVTETGDGELRPEVLPARQEGEALVRTCIRVSAAALSVLSTRAAFRSAWLA